MLNIYTSMNEQRKEADERSLMSLAGLNYDDFPFDDLPQFAELKKDDVKQDPTHSLIEEAKEDSDS